MGQHKYNPTAIAAKNGELPPKKKKMSKAEEQFLMYNALEKAMHDRGLLTPNDICKIGKIDSYY